MKKRIIAFSILVLFTCSFILVDPLTSGSARAVSLFETNQRIIKEYEAQKQAYQDKVRSYSDIKTDFTSLRSRYERNKTETDKTLLLEKVKLYFPATIDTMIAFLETAKKKVESSSALSVEEQAALLSEIDKDIDYLNQQKTAIANADDLTTARETVRTIRDYWLRTRARVKRWTGKLMWAKVNHLLTRLENVADKLEEEINALKAEGQDVAELEAWLADFRKHLDLASQKLAHAKEKFEAISNYSEAAEFFRQAHQYLREANQYLRHAHQDLRKIVRKLKLFRHRIVKISGTGTLYVQGNGKVALIGNGTIEGTVDTQGAGTVLVVDKAGDAVVETSGEGHKEVLGENKTRYSGIGSIKVTGTDIIVVITGAGLNVQAYGSGTALLRGEGKYKTDNGEWLDIPPGGLEVSLQ